MDLTKENLENELWRLNNLYYIKDKNGNKVRFQMNRVQRFLYENLWYLNIILKARQLGCTTFFQLFYLDRCLFNDNTNAGVIAHTQVDAQAFFDDKLLFAYENLPEEIRRENPADTKNVRELKFANGSRIRVGTSMRSGTLQYLHISEFGKICAKYPDKAKEIVTGSLNTVAPGNFISIESTAEGAHGEFYDRCLEAEAIQESGQKLSKMDYKFFFFPWYEDPEYVLYVTEATPIPDAYKEYFDTLEKEEGIVLRPEQKQWYVAKGQGAERRHAPGVPIDSRRGI